jgi:hypothetical protein
MDSKDRKKSRIPNDKIVLDDFNAGLSASQMQKKYGVNRSSVNRRLKVLGLSREGIKNRIERQLGRAALEHSAEVEQKTIDLIQQLHAMILAMDKIRTDNERDTTEEISLMKHIAKGFGKSGKLLVKSKKKREAFEREIQDIITALSENKLEKQQIIINSVRAETPLLSVSRDLQQYLAEADAISYAVKYLLDEVEKESPELREKVARRLYEAQRARNILPPSTEHVVTVDARAPRSVP